MPENSYLWQQKAMPLFKQKKYEIGMVFLDSAVKHGKTNEWQEYRGFIKCIFQKNYNGAIADLQYVKSKNENGITMDHSFNFYIGLSYLQLNKFDSACSYLQKSIDYGERNSGHGHFLEYFYLGITKMEMEDYENAIINFDKSIKIASRFSDAKYYKAASLNSLNKYNDALDLLNESLNDFKKGYTINEDNALYEDYPYQIKTRQIESFIKKMTERAK
jgi:tetratricopeptide (TPR) repeat protein